MSTQKQTEYDPIVEGPLNFCEQFAEILGENFLVEDMVWQEDLFEIQDKLARLICAAANSNSSDYRYFMNAQGTHNKLSKIKKLIESI
jgi:hypothetical protein